MVEKDIQFTIQNEYGKDIDCFILVSKPISRNEINVLFNQSNDKDNTIRYAKIIRDNNSYSLSNKISIEELDELKDLLDKEIKNFAFKLYDNEEQLI